MRKISFISAWAQGIIVAVIIATIIEMILPESSSSKYIKTVIGIFILFTIISPLLSKIKGNNEMLDLEEYVDVSSDQFDEVNSKLDNNELIKNMYIENLKIDIKSKISQKGYVVGEVGVEILDNSEYTLNSIFVRIIGTSEKKNNTKNTATIVENVEQVLISVTGQNNAKKEEEKSVISVAEKRRIIQYLSGVYEVKESNINVQ